MCFLPARQLLDLSRPSYMHCASHVLHLSIILSSIASCFITFMHLYGFLVSLDHLRSSLCFSGEALQFLVPFVNHDKKGEKMWFPFKILHVRGENACLKVKFNVLKFKFKQHNINISFYQTIISTTMQKIKCIIF